MAYEINKSDGTTITINDGQINNVDSNMQLIGRNRADYGAPIAQNFVRLIENFAAESSPDANPNVSGDPLAGQLWYKPSTNTLSVYDGTTWQSILTAGGLHIPNPHTRPKTECLHRWSLGPALPANPGSLLHHSGEMPPPARHSRSTPGRSPLRHHSRELGEFGRCARPEYAAVPP